MNKKNIGIAALVAVIVILLAFSGGARTRELSGASFVETYQKTPGAVLLDVRTPSEFAVGHLEGALNVDFESPIFAEEIRKLDKEKEYFVYCRSGNRSGQAIAIMKKEGFEHVSELQGGIVSNQSTLRFVAATATSEPEYVVDSGDMVNGVRLIAGTSRSALNVNETNGLIQMREEEKLAKDVYTTLGAKWGMRIFSNIASSEQTHTDAVKALLDRYSIADPAADAAVGVFRSPTIQKLYDDLTTRGLQSRVDALMVGATVEDLDIHDLDVLMGETTKEDIVITYRNLQKGSRNHLRAFIRNISAAGWTYSPQYISRESFDSIVSSPQERGTI